MWSNGREIHDEVRRSTNGIVQLLDAEVFVTTTDRSEGVVVEKDRQKAVDRDSETPEDTRIRGFCTHDGYNHLILARLRSVGLSGNASEDVVVRGGSTPRSTVFDRDVNIRILDGSDQPGPDSCRGGAGKQRAKKGCARSIGRSERAPRSCRQFGDANGIGEHHVGRRLSVEIGKQKDLSQRARSVKHRPGEQEACTRVVQASGDRSGDDRPSYGAL